MESGADQRQRTIMAVCARSPNRNPVILLPGRYFMGMASVTLILIPVVYLCTLPCVTDSCPDGTYGYNCGYTCNCDLDRCDPTPGCSPPNCSPGWSGPTCQKHNIARGKATASSGDKDFPSSKATDGSTAANSYLVCINTKPSNLNWWRVDLNDTVLIRDVTIYFRTDHTPRRNGIQVYVTNSTDAPSGDKCYNVTGNSDGSNIDDVTRAPCSGRGRYILLYTTVSNEAGLLPTLDFCEVEVDVCGPGTFGADCDNYCHCDGEVCSYANGVCPSGSCMSGWIGDSCSMTCETGRYGRGCAKSCTDRQCKGNTSSCSHDTGECSGGCLAGYRTQDCTQECVDTYGEDCGSHCSDRHCSDTSSSRCDHVTGLCDGGCRPGWKGVDCRTGHSCCFSCETGLYAGCVQDVEYGPECVGNCSARMCEGGLDDCHLGTGRCDGGCQSGWTGVDCTQHDSTRNGSNTTMEVSSLSAITNISPVVAGVFGAVTMLVVLAMVEGVVCLCRKGDFRLGKKRPRQDPETSPAPPVEPPTYDVLPEHDYTKLDRIHTEHYDTLRPIVDYQNSDVRV